jgi:hypothetical protein
MRLRILLRGVLLAFVFISVTSSGLWGQTLIQGTVTDSVLSPIVNAIVSPYPLLSAIDTTDADGFYSIDGYPPGSYNLRFMHPEYFMTYLRDIQLAENETITVDAVMHRHP